jgi:hypothetical protein
VPADAVGQPGVGVAEVRSVGYVATGAVAVCGLFDVYLAVVAILTMRVY